MQDEQGIDLQSVKALKERGVIIPAPELVYIRKDVPLDAIAPDAVLYPFCRLGGTRTQIDEGAKIGPGGGATLENTWVGRHAVVGSLGPVTLLNATLGARVVLGSGVAEQAVFLDREGKAPDFTTGFGFRVRKGSLYEEGANSAQHTDTKMTVLMPWVTLGSNLNWCDILVAGGVGPGLGQFTEVGSGAIHFNFTPRGDKATGSMLGNVTQGVFLRQERLFVGGNTSLLGPARMDFGALAPAGERFSGHLKPGLNQGQRATAPASKAAPASGSAEAQPAFDVEIYGAIQRMVQSQVAAIGQLAALDAWYAGVRQTIAGENNQRRALYAKGREMVLMNLRERIAQLEALAGRMERSVIKLETRHPHDPRIVQQRAFIGAWPRMAAHFAPWGSKNAEMQSVAAVLPTELENGLHEAMESMAGSPEHAGSKEYGGGSPDYLAYTAVIQALPQFAVEAGMGWLVGIAEQVASQEMMEAVPPLDQAAKGKKH